MNSAINFDTVGNCADSGASVINWFVLFQDLSWSVFRAICDELEKDVIQLKLVEKIVRKVQFSNFSLNIDFRTGLGRKLWGQRRHWKGNRINPASHRLGDQFQIPDRSGSPGKIIFWVKKYKRPIFLSDYSLLTVRKNNADFSHASYTTWNQRQISSLKVFPLVKKAWPARRTALAHHIIGKWADQKGNFPRIGARPFQTFSEQSKVIFSKSFFRIVQSGLFTSCVTEKNPF